MNARFFPGTHALFPDFAEMPPDAEQKTLFDWYEWIIELRERTPKDQFEQFFFGQDHPWVGEPF